MKRRKAIAIILAVFLLAGTGIGIWWYHENNIEITLPVDEKTAIEISKRAIRNKYWKELIATGSFWYGDNVVFDARMLINSLENRVYWSVSMYIRGYDESTSLVHIDVDTGEVLLLYW